MATVTRRGPNQWRVCVRLRGQLATKTFPSRPEAHGWAARPKGHAARHLTLCESAKSGYVSNPANNYFTNLTVGRNGYLVGGAGDQWFVSGNFVNNSLQNTSWSTGASSLFLNGTGTQQLLLAGANFGTSRAGYVNSFAWGSFTLGAGESVNVGDGNSTSGAALYVGLFQRGGGSRSSAASPAITTRHRPVDRGCGTRARHGVALRLGSAGSRRLGPASARR